MKTIIFLTPLLMLSASLAGAANVEQKSLEIQGQTAVQIEKAEEIHPIKKIEEKKAAMPELPQPLKEGKPSEAEKLKIDRVDQSEAIASINPVEAAVEKDNQVREANLKF